MVQRPTIYTDDEIVARMHEIVEDDVACNPVDRSDIMRTLNEYPGPVPVLDALAMGMVLQAVTTKQYYVFYTHLIDGTSHCITCDVLEEAQIIWDTFKKMYNSYNMKSSRPAARPQINGAR